jgi:peptidoglycan/LPS O-acetylase OafA/YrhL
VAGDLRDQARPEVAAIINAVPVPNETKPALPRLDGVDVLRGLYILAVVLLHILIRFSFVGVKLGADWPKYTQHFVFFNGGNGVTIFFAVSGFLITLTSLRRFGSLAKLHPSVFYRIRFARIMPLLLLLLAVLSVLHLAHVDGFSIHTKVFTLPRALLAALTFHLNWLEASRNAYLPACWTVLWSLSIEEMFYLFFPLACVVLLRRGRWGIWVFVGLCLALVAMGPFARVVWSKTELAQENSYLAGMASIALGCLTALAANRWKAREWSRKYLLGVGTAGCVLILLIAIWPRWHAMRVLGSSGTDDTLLALGTCLVMFAVALRDRHGNTLSAPVRWFGRHSYEIYLSHEFVVIAGVGLFAHWYPHGASRAVVAAFVSVMLLLTALLGWPLAKWFAEPMNRRLRGATPAK